MRDRRPVRVPEKGGLTRERPGFSQDLSGKNRPVTAKSWSVPSVLHCQHGWLRGVIRSDIVDVLHRQPAGEIGHDRILARAGFVIAQRLGEIVLTLTAELRIIGRRAVAVHGVAGLADFLALAFSPTHVPPPPPLPAT